MVQLLPSDVATLPRAHREPLTPSTLPAPPPLASAVVRVNPHKSPHKTKNEVQAIPYSEHQTCFPPAVAKNAEGLHAASLQLLACRKRLWINSLRWVATVPDP